MTKCLETDEGQLAYEICGEGPLVVLVHGLGDDRTSYAGVVPHLVRAGHRVAAMDLRGCGESSADWSDYGRTAIARDIAVLIEHLGGQAVLVGHSIAGGAATIVAATRPELVAAVVELSPFTRKQSFGLSMLTHSRVRKGTMSLLIAGELGRTKSWTTYLTVATPGDKPSDWADRLDHVTESMSRPGRMAALKAMIRSKPADAGEHLSAVRRPVLVVMGDQDPDWVDPRAEADGIVAELPTGTGTVHMLAGVGHYPHYQRPREVAELVADTARRAGHRA